MVGEGRIELPPHGPKPRIIPLDHSPYFFQKSLPEKEDLEYLQGAASGNRTRTPLGGTRF